jgi:hypothetical protein
MSTSRPQQLSQQQPQQQQHQQQQPQEPSQGNLNDAYAPLHGVVDGVYVATGERVDELSNKMFARNMPSHDIQPMFGLRPVASKYTVMPIYDQYKPCVESIQVKPVFQPQSPEIFYPGTRNAPYNGYASKVNVESTLRNQWFALQRGSQSVYVPSSESDLYKTTVEYKPVLLPHPYINSNSTEHFAAHNPNTMNIAKGVFENSTRVQLKDLPY